MLWNNKLGVIYILCNLSYYNNDKVFNYSYVF